MEREMAAIRWRLCFVRVNARTNLSLVIKVLSTLLCKKKNHLMRRQTYLPMHMMTFNPQYWWRKGQDNNNNNNVDFLVLQIVTDAVLIKLGRFE